MKEETSHIIAYKALNELIESLTRLRNEIIIYELGSTENVVKYFNALDSVLCKYIFIDNRGHIWSRTGVNKKNEYVDSKTFLLAGEDPIIGHKTMFLEILNELGINITEEDKRIIESQYASIYQLVFLFGELHSLMVWHRELIKKLTMLYDTSKELNKMTGSENYIKLDKLIIKKLLEFREQLFMYLDSIDFLKNVLTIIFREYSKHKIIDDEIIFVGDSALINLTTKDCLAFSDCQLWSEGSIYNPSYKALIHYRYKSEKELRLDENFLKNIIEIFHLIFYKAMLTNKTYYTKVFKALEKIQYLEILSAFIQFERTIKNESLLRFARDL